MKLKIITSNMGKVKEFQSAMSPLGIDVQHAKISYDEVQTSELEEVVRKGLEELRKQGLNNFIIDDSGLFVDGLKGFPGVYSSYVQKTVGNQGILNLMEGRVNREAEFRCCIGCDINGETMIVTGICKGRILENERGSEGFGFDPIFSADGKRSFAEIPMEEKNMLSHRGNAIQLLVKELKERSMV